MVLALHHLCFVFWCFTQPRNSDICDVGWWLRRPHVACEYHCRYIGPASQYFATISDVDLRPVEVRDWSLRTMKSKNRRDSFIAFVHDCMASVERTGWYTTEEGCNGEPGLFQNAPCMDNRAAFFSHEDFRNALVILNEGFHNSAERDVRRYSGTAETTDMQRHDFSLLSITPLLLTLCSFLPCVLDLRPTT